jgi:TonB-linked SusC/RagA family outer membrane protein
MKKLGNPVAIANLAYNNQSTYRISPQFNLRYKLLGKSPDEGHVLDLNAEIYMDIFNEAVNTYYSKNLTTDSWADDVNTASNSDFSSISITNREKLNFIPKFNNENISMNFLGQFEIWSENSSRQSSSQSGLPTGLESPITEAFVKGTDTSTGKAHRMSYLGSAHIAFFDGRYSFDATVRRDGSTKFGAGRKWGTFPGISARWNINQEPFFEKLHVGHVISMLSFRPSWGKVGREPSDEYLMYNTYSNKGVYGNGKAIGADNLRLTDIQWETTKSWNLGANLNFFDDLIMIDFNYYNKNTDDLLMANVRVPGSSGYSSLAWQNTGSLRNRGWELYINTGKFLKKGDFSMSVSFNIAQNVNTITYMDASVLASMNGDFNYENANYLKRIQIGNAVGSIYGFRYLGVYAYDYEHNGYTAESAATYGDKTAKAAEERGEVATVPVARDAQGNILYDSKGNPLHMYFNYGNINYEFKGGDVIYEDVNHDGEINELDIVYLGNSNPKVNGGFGLNFNYGAWTLKMSFNYRLGNRIVNMARMANECMRTNINQSQAVAWRWRKNGDVTEIPRAMNASVGASYNELANDRYVEKGDFLRLQYMQFGYALPAKTVQKWGLQSIRFNASANNLFVLTKYTGVDPEVSYGSWGVCYDNSKTPRSKSFTVSVNIGF